MKKLSILFFCAAALLSTNCFAQERAVTSNGDEVILNADGTWKMANPEAKRKSRIDTNAVSIKKPGNSTFIVKSNRLNCGMYIDPKKWSFSKGKPGEIIEFRFTLKEKDAYGMLISEKTEIPLESLQSIAIDNAREAIPDVEVIKEEYRKVNDNIVLVMQMNGTLKGIKATYLGYYYSAPEGSVQFITYTSTNLFEEQKKDMEELLNGFVSIKD